MSNARNLANLKPSTSGLIETDDLTDASVTTAKLPDGVITQAKLNAAVVLGGKAANRQVFTANGTWTKPAGFKSTNTA